jgi:hypothetical protein
VFLQQINSDEDDSLLEFCAVTDVSDVSFYKITRLIVPEDCHLHIRRHENMRFNIISDPFKCEDVELSN